MQESNARDSTQFTRPKGRKAERRVSRDRKTYQGLAPALSLREWLGAGWKGSQQGTEAEREEQVREQVELGLQHTANAIVTTTTLRTRLTSET